MKWNLKNNSVVVILILLLTACSNSSQSNIENKKEVSKQTSLQNSQQSKNHSVVTNEKEETMVVAPLPTTYEELAKLPVGKNYNMDTSSSNSDAEIRKVFKDLPDISGTVSDKELDYFYMELLKRLQQGYEGPENIIRRLKFQSLGNPDSSDSRYQFKDSLNVEFIIDASGSMAQKINGKSKMEAAKDSILDFVSKLPKKAKVGIRVYGHKGSGADSDKKLSCRSSELVYSISNFNEGKFKSALDKFTPKGWTPIGLALKEAKKDLSIYEGENNTNIVYLVSDGIDTCNDDPINAAKDLYSSDISPIINVLGFDVDSAGQNQLKRIAESTQGIYETINNESELQKELDKLRDLTNQWETWLEQGNQKIESKKLVNGLDIFSYITNEGAKASTERDKIYLILHTLYEANYFKRESYDYLVNKNSEYHQWIKEEISKFDDELKVLNKKGYNEALEELQEKYNTNTQ